MTRRFIVASLLSSLPACLSAQSAKPALPQTSEEVTVTASRGSVPVGETAKTIYSLDSTALHDYPALVLDEALRQHAGFELFRRAPSRVANPTSEGISLRGLGSTAASRTLVLEDGAPLNDPFGGWIHWDEQPVQTIKSVTLVTGGGSDLYGSSALGGVIDVTPVSVDPTRIDLSAAGGSQDTSDLQTTLSHAGRHAGILLAGQSLRTGGYRPVDPSLAGAVDVPANVRAQSYRAELGRRDFAQQRFFLTGNLLNEDRSNGTPLQTNATRFWRYLAGYNTPEGKLFTGRVRAFGSDQGYRQSFSSIAANRNSEALTRLQRVHSQELGLSTDGSTHFRSLVFVGGVDVRDIRANDVERPITSGVESGLQAVTARQRFIGGFGEVLGQRGPWSAVASLRADRASNLDIVQTTTSGAGIVKTTPPDRDEVVLSPRAGLTRSVGPGASVHASGFRAFRTPTMNELYRTGQVGQETTRANSALLSERATGFEAGGEYATRKRALALQGTYFWTEINRPVSAVLLSQTATTITDQRQNLGQIRSQGVELALRVRPSGPVSASLGYQYANAIVTRFAAQPSLVGNWIPQVPRQSFTAQVWAASERYGTLTLAVRSSGTSYDDSANQFALAKFLQVDLSGSKEIGRRLEVFFLAQNLTDRRPQVSRTPVLTLGSPLFAEGGLRFHLSRTK